MWRVLVLALSAVSACTMDGYTGPVQFLDGDTVRVSGYRFLLYGIDAPELGQQCRDRKSGRIWPCGNTAANLLQSRLGGKEVTCFPTNTGLGGPIAARCYLGEIDLARYLVEEGIALAERGYTDIYVEAEAQARREGQGLWGSDMEAPAAFRARQRVEQGYDSPIHGCDIKGTDGYDGRIYYEPGDIGYWDIRIDPAGSGRWFCSRHGAERAGWRAAER